MDSDILQSDSAIWDILIAAGTEFNRKTLYVAISEGKFNNVKLLLQAGIDPNTEYTDRHTALMIASENGDLDIVELLLEYGADPTVESIWWVCSLLCFRQRKSGNCQTSNNSWCATKHIFT